MKVIDPGHEYRLDFLDGKGLQCTVFLSGQRNIIRNDTLTFVKREGEGYPGNEGKHAGTTMQEVLRVLIDRVKYLDSQKPHDSNESTVLHLRDALLSLEYRAAERHSRLEEFKARISEEDLPELLPTCSKCLHIGCEGACHP